jgi:hypothetical protein
MFPIQDDPYWKSSPFDEMRPLSLPAEKRNHIHGAVDIATVNGSAIYAEEDGYSYAIIILREKKRGNNLFWIDEKWFAFSNYFYDVFGGCVILEGYSGLTYLHAHVYADTILNKYPFEVHEKHDEDGWVFSMYSFNDTVGVKEGDIIGYVGNAGQSTGPHLHLEIHDKRNWLRWEKRPNPEGLWPKELK